MMVHVLTYFIKHLESYNRITVTELIHAGSY
jgi:hypothetical protein